MPCKYYKLKLSFKSFILFASWIILAHFAISHCKSRTKFHILCKLRCNIWEERKNTLTFFFATLTILTPPVTPRTTINHNICYIRLQKLFPPLKHLTAFSRLYTILESDLLLKNKLKCSFKRIALTTIRQYAVQMMGTFDVWVSDFKT